MSESSFRLGYRPVLDGVRGLSILLVLIHHIDTFLPVGVSILSAGFLGVDIFFVLSGFLITSILVEEFETTGTVSFRRFYIRRALRLFPAVGAVLLFSVVVGYVIGFGWLGFTSLRVLSIVGYFTNWLTAFETPDLWFLSHFWSLAIEEQFYLFWPITLIGLLRLRMPRRGVLLTTTALILASVALMAALHSSGASLLRLYTGSDTRAHSLLVGCWFSLALHWGYLKAESVKRHQPLAWMSFIALLAAAFLLSISDKVLYVGGSFIVAVFAAILILSLVISDKNLLSAIFSHPVMLWLGKRSYGLYIWHWPCFYLCTFLRPPLAIPGAIISSVVAAAFSYRFIELPFLKMKARFSAKGASRIGSVAHAQSSTPTEALGKFI